MELPISRKKIGPIEIKVEVGTCSLPSKAEEIVTAFKRELSRFKEEGIERWSVTHVGCRGLCFRTPLVEVKTPHLGKTIYQNVKPQDVSQMVVDHIIKGKSLESLTVDHFYQKFLSKQERRVLGNCGEIDPDSIESYLGAGGFSGLEKALKKMRPEEVLREIKDSKLRDRDALAFFTGEKLETYKKQVKRPKYLICSGEGEASEACISTALMEGDPFALIEGMTIAAYCLTGVERGYIFCRKEGHPLVIKRVENAIKSSREKGYLGGNIMGTSFGFDMELKENGEVFHPKGNAVCCKECAHLLLESGGNGPPVEKPLYVIDFETLWHLNNVFNPETFANIPLISKHGSSWFRAVGRPESTGTKIFSLVGDVKQGGLVEVPFGTALSQILSLSNNEMNDIKAFMLGGLGSGFLPKELLHTPLSHSELESMGNRVGSGKILIIDQSHSMVDMTCYAVQRMVDDSCERCQPCVQLLNSILTLLDKIVEGHARLEDLFLLRQVAENLRENALCEFGRLAPTVILSSLNHFEEEYRNSLV
ncbi:MAG: hypothetical protein AMJ42_05200 [Deltaproteobacteria bacterium DG_8]|nr:MAG: hypothetical protein AMJ42_05200 [Deltaproteobacteria bacterium DG_8]